MVTPFRVQKYLSGLRYPACKAQIVNRALQKGADERVLGVLRAIPERWYPSPVALSGQIGHPEHSLRGGEGADAQDPAPDAAG
jgi:hypothetical protein